MSESHAVLEAQCAACHVQAAGSFSAKASDAACLSCHDGPVHHASSIGTTSCSTCHTEHRGRVNLVAASNESCATCHGDLRASGGLAHFQTGIYSFESGHPEFAALREQGKDPGTIRVNHAIHMKPIRRGPNGPNVQLKCDDCHRTAAEKAGWSYADASYVAAKTSYSMQDELVMAKSSAFERPHPMGGRELMAPVKFANACAGCHLLTFDKRFDEGVPHDTPEVVHAFLVKKFGDYIAAHPSETRVTRDPGRDLSGKPLAANVRVLTPAQWVTERTADAEDLLWRKTCKQCHELTATAGLPQIAAANTTQQWMPHSRFDHDAHQGFSCTSCHQKAMSSTETSDVLLPGISTCKTCHAPSPEHAESRCFECHTYHDWSKRKNTEPSFTLPALKTSGN